MENASVYCGFTILCEAVYKVILSPLNGISHPLPFYLL
jgi:hypothetical protein